MSVDQRTSELLASVVFPIGADASEWLETRVGEIHAVLTGLFKDFEIVIVDNAGGACQAEVQALQQRLRNIQYYRLAKPITEDAAFVAGIEAAIGDVVLSLDPRHDPAAVMADMVGLFYEGADIVYGVDELREQRDPIARRWFRWVFHRLYRWATDTELPAGVTRLRLLSRRAVNSFVDNEDRYELFYVIPFFAGLPNARLVYRRQDMTPKIRQTFLRDLWRGISCIILSSNRPIRLISLVAVLGALASLCYSFYVVLVYFTSEVAGGWSSLSLQVSGLFLILFLLVAVIAEYVGRLHVHLQRRLPYVIASESSSVLLQRKEDLNVSRVEDSLPGNVGRDAVGGQVAHRLSNSISPPAD